MTSATISCKLTIAPMPASFPTSGMSKNPAQNAPASEPTVLSMYAKPIDFPTFETDLVYIFPTRGKVAPKQSVGKIMNRKSMLTCNRLNRPN